MRTAARLAIGLLGLLVVTGACRATPPAPQAATPAATPVATVTSSPATAGLNPDARAAYDLGLGAAREGDLASAARGFSRAAELQPDFTEAWYNLGAATSRQAAEVAGRGHDAEALQLFRAAVGHKRRAGELIASDTWWIYDEGQQAVVRSDLENALRDADAVLADEKSLLIALRMQAGARPTP